MKEKVSFTGDEMRFTDEDGNVDVVRCFLTCYEVQLHGKKTVIFPRKRDDDDFVCAKKVYEELKRGYERLERLIHKELDCDRKMAEAAEGEEEYETPCECCNGGMYNMCLNFTVTKLNEMIPREKLWERYHELCCDENPVIAEAFINEAIDEDCCLQHCVSKDGVELVTSGSLPSVIRRYWEENNFHSTESSAEEIPRFNFLEYKKE